MSFRIVLERSCLLELSWRKNFQHRKKYLWVSRRNQVERLWLCNCIGLYTWKNMECLQIYLWVPFGKFLEWNFLCKGYFLQRWPYPRRKDQQVCMSWRNPLEWKMVSSQRMQRRANLEWKGMCLWRRFQFQWLLVLVVHKRARMESKDQNVRLPSELRLEWKLLWKESKLYRKQSLECLYQAMYLPKQWILEWFQLYGQTLMLLWEDLERNFPSVQLPWIF